MTKNCNSCKQTKTLRHYFKDRTKKLGVSDTCKECKKIYRRKWAAENRNLTRAYRSKHEINKHGAGVYYSNRLAFLRQRLFAAMRKNVDLLTSRLNARFGAIKSATDMRLCHHCKSFLPIDRFSRKSSNRSGFDSACMRCDYKMRTSTIEKRMAYRAKHIRLRGRKAGIDEKLTGEDVGRIYQAFNERCYKCGAQDKLCLDHHQPVRTKIALTQSNAVVLCVRCNTAKHQRDPSEFYSKKELKRLRDGYGVGGG